MGSWIMDVMLPSIIPWRVGIPTTQEGLSIIDLVYASDRNKFRSDLINNVNVPWQQGEERKWFKRNESTMFFLVHCASNLIFSGSKSCQTVSVWIICVAHIRLTQTYIPRPSVWVSTFRSQVIFRPKRRIQVYVVIYIYIITFVGGRRSLFSEEFMSSGDVAGSRGVKPGMMQLFASWNCSGLWENGCILYKFALDSHVFDVSEY